MEDTFLPHSKLSLLKKLGWRISIFIACLVVLVVVGLLVHDKSPIYWWMPTQRTQLEPTAPFSLVDVGQPLLGRFRQVNPLAEVSPGVCNVLLSQHAHTLHSDGSMTVQQVLDWHIAQGFTAVAVTDHNDWQGGLEAVEAAKRMPGIVALAGMEWSHCRGHYNFILPSAAAAALDFESANSQWVVRNQSLPSPRTTPLMVPMSLRKRALHTLQVDAQPDDNILAIPLVKYPSDTQMQQAFATVHSLGGVVVANHLPWSAWNLQRNQLPNRTALAKWGVDYVELVHEADFDAKSLPIVREHGMGPVAGMDLHFPSQRAYGWTCLSATDPNDEASVLAALRQPSGADVIFDAEGTTGMSVYDDLPQVGIFFSPLRWLGDYFHGFYGVSPKGGTDTYAYSFVDGYCGLEPSYALRWGCIFAGVFWLVSFFTAYHLVLFVSARCKGESLDSAL